MSEQPQTVEFRSHGTRCEAWHLPAADDRLAGPGGRPVVVMAHGLGGTRDSGLLPFAEAFAAAGMEVVAFDYRGFGGSEGEPRQLVRMADQVEDYRAALAYAAGLPGVDPQRLVLWGVSMSGGHVLRVAADRGDVAAVVALVPLVDGVAAMRQAMATYSPGQLARSSVDGMRARAQRLAGRTPASTPVVAKPGERGLMSTPGAYESYLQIAGPTWRNEVVADVSLELGTRAPVSAASQVTAPLLVQIADFDQSAPPYAAAKAAVKGRAQVRHYPCDHFDVLTPGRWRDTAVDHAVRFLTRALAADDLESAGGGR